MATRDGAKALGIGDSTGSLEVGKAADFIAVSMDAVECTPLYNIFSQLVYSTGRDRVTDVWVAGRRLMQGRRLLTMEESKVRKAAVGWSAKISAWAAKQ